MEGSTGLKAAVLFLLSVILLLGVESVRHDSLTDDEPEHYLYGVKILAGDATRYNNSKMPITALNALPAWLAVALPPGPLQAFLGRIETGRYVTIAFSLLVAACVFSWSRDLYGPAAGLSLAFPVCLRSEHHRPLTAHHDRRLRLRHDPDRPVLLLALREAGRMAEGSLERGHASAWRRSPNTRPSICTRS